MAQISLYPVVSPKLVDTFVVSQGYDPNAGDPIIGNPTGLVSIGGLVDLINSGLIPGSGTVTSVSGTGTVSGLTLTGTVTSTGSLTLGGTLTLTSSQITTGLGFTPYNDTNPSGFTSFAEPAIFSSGGTPELASSITADDIKDLLNIGSSVTEVEDNSGLAISSNILTTVYDTTIEDSVLSVPVGGAPATAASVWGSKTIVQVLDTILFPTILASISRNKSASLVTSPSTSTVEVGTVVNRTLTAVLDTGQIQNGNETAGPTLVGGPLSTNAYVFTGTGINKTTQTANALSIVGSEAILGANTWNVTINHSIGTGDYYNNKGEVGTNLDANRVAGTVTDSTSVITGKYKHFFGPSASAVTSSAEVRGLSNSRFDNTGSFVTPIFNDVKFVIAIPATRTLVSVITSNNETITANFVLSTFNVNDAGGNAVSYDVYTFTSVIALGVTATVTIS